MNAIRPIVAPLLVLFAFESAGAAILFWGARVLPENIASHFDAQGKPDGWMTRTRYLQSMAALGLVTPLFLLGIGLAIRSVPNDFINVPHAHYWLSAEHRSETNRYFAISFAWMACLVTGQVFALNWLVIEANREATPRLSNGVWLLLLCFFGVVACWIGSMIWHFSRSPGSADDSSAS